MIDPFSALVHDAYAKRPWLGDLFKQQRRAILSRARRKAILCGRRSGKTVTAAAKLADALDEADFDEAVVYAARTRAIARRLIWAKLHKLARDHGRESDWTFSETDLTVTNKRGGFILIVGLDKPAEIEKLRGLKIRLFVGDEPATYSSILEPLYDEILEPACADLDGEIWFVGTPGKVLAGFWYGISSGKFTRQDEDGDDESVEDWEVHHWTMFDNPHMKNPRAFLDRVMRRKGWSEDDATVQQEYFGRWTADDSAQVYRYLPSRNDAQARPKHYDRDTWAISMAVDFGIGDSFAWSVVGAHRDERCTYTLTSGKVAGLLVDEMAEIVAKVVDEFRPDRLFGDPGGGGKALIDEWNKRWASKAGGIGMEIAPKAEKLAHIELFNTELRTGRHKFVQPDCKELTTEIELLPWHKPELRTKEHPAYPNDCADSNLYAWRGLFAYMHEAPEKPPHPAIDPNRYDAWETQREIEEYERQQRELEDYW